jgi:hypothetical protein
MSIEWLKRGAVSAYYSRWTALLILLLGVFLRVNRYLFNRSLWLDEAYLALNIVPRSFAQLLTPLDYGQAAPVGFLLLEKVAQVVFGNRETSLRLLPLLSGLAALLLFYPLARRSIGATAVPIALLLFAVSDSLGDYSSELKQYSGDVFFSVILILLASHVRRRKPNSQGLFLFGLTGIVAVWLSHAASLVLIGVGLTILVSDGVRKDRSSLLRWTPVFSAWGGSFLISYFVSLRGLLGTEGLARFWSNHGAFATFLPLSLSRLEGIVGLWGAMLADPLGFAATGAAAVCLLLGAVSMLDGKRETLALVLAPVFLAFILSAWQMYPFQGRLLLFAVPLLLLPLAEGVGALIDRTGRFRWVLAIGLALVLLYQPVKVGLARGLHPRYKEEMRPVVAYLKERYRPGDVVYLYYASQYAFKYYAGQLGAGDIPALNGHAYGADPHRYLEEIAALGRGKKVWLVFSHNLSGPLGDEEQYILRFMDCAGSRVDSYVPIGASVYMYDLTEAATSEQAISSCLGARGP